MSSSVGTSVHPVVAAVRDAHLALTETAQAPLWSLSDAELEALHDQTRDLLAAVTARRAMVLGELAARGITTRTGAATTTAWLRGRDTLTGAAASWQAKVAAFLPGPQRLA